MSTRWPAQVKSTAIARRRRPPACEAAASGGHARPPPGDCGEGGELSATRSTSRRCSLISGSVARAPRATCTPRAGLRTGRSAGRARRRGAARCRRGGTAGHPSRSPFVGAAAMWTPARVAAPGEKSLSGAKDLPMRVAPAARGAFVRSADEGERRAGEDLQVDERRAVLDVPDVELDALVPGQARAAVDLRPAGQPRLDLEAASLARRVALDLVERASAAARSRSCRRGRRSRAAAARRSTRRRRNARRA